MGKIKGSTIEAAIILTNGFEVSEALTTLDILRRGQVAVQTVSMTGEQIVTSQTGLPVKADFLFDEVENMLDIQMIILPGGSVLEGYQQNQKLIDFVHSFHEKNKAISAICAAPAFLASLGILKGRVATCYPSLEGMLSESVIGKDIVCKDGNIITSRGPATAMFFAFEILRTFKEPQFVEELKKSYLVDYIL